MLDDPDASHTKSIINYFGNIDRLHVNTGPQGFDKFTDDLILKYGANLLSSEEFLWRKKENQNVASDLKLAQKYFDEKQSGLMVSGVEEPEAILLTTENKIQKVVTACNKSHNGPIISNEELHQLVSALNLEIRYRYTLSFILILKELLTFICRKVTFNKIKDLCPLFLQRKLSIEKKIENLYLLIESQSINMTALADMDDL